MGWFFLLFGFCGGQLLVRVGHRKFLARACCLPGALFDRSVSFLFYLGQFEDGVLFDAAVAGSSYIVREESSWVLRCITGPWASTLSLIGDYLAITCVLLSADERIWAVYAYRNFASWSYASESAAQRS